MNIFMRGFANLRCLRCQTTCLHDTCCFSVGTGAILLASVIKQAVRIFECQSTVGSLPAEPTVDWMFLHNYPAMDTNIWGLNKSPDDLRRTSRDARLGNRFVAIRFRVLPLTPQ